MTSNATTRTNTFTMPAEGTPEYDALMQRWATKPISFGSCKRLKALFRELVADDGTIRADIKISAKDRKAWNALVKRNEDRTWPNLRSDVLSEAGWTMKTGHELGKTLEKLTGGNVTTSTVPAPANPAPAAPAAPQAVDQHVYSDGDLIMVRTATGVETKRVNVNGKRVTIGRI